MSKYVRPSKIQEEFAVSSSTLRRWAVSGKIRTIQLPGRGDRLYDYNQFLQLVGAPIPKEPTHTRKRYCYARVSSSHQKADLGRQVEYLHQQYPDTKIIKDIGSGINWGRKGIRTLLDQVVQGDVYEIVVTHKDRLCRFGYDLLQWMFQKFDCKIVVLDKVTNTTPEVELSQDLLSVVNYFTAKNNGMRSAQNRKKRNAQSKKDQTVSNNDTKENTETMVRSVEMDVQPVCASV